MPDYDYPITITFDEGEYTHRPEFAERIPQGQRDYKPYNANNPEMWFAKYRRYARIVLISHEEAPINEEDFVVFEDPLHPYDLYRIGIKAGDWDDVQNLYEELRVILNQKPVNSTYTKAEFPKRPRYTRRRNCVYGVFEVKLYKDY